MAGGEGVCGKGTNDDDDRLGSRLGSLKKKEEREEKRRECAKIEAIGGMRNSVSRGEWRREREERQVTGML